MSTVLDQPTPGAERPTPDATAHSAVRRVAINALSPFAAQLVTKLLMLGYLLVQYRLIGGGRHALDEYFLAGSVFLYTSTIADWGLTTLVTREAARDHDQPERVALLFQQTLSLRLLISAALFLPVGLYIAIYATLFDLSAQGGWATLILTACLLPAAFSGSVTALLYAYERMTLPATIGVVTSLVNVVLGVGALMLGWGITGLALAAFFATCLTALIFWRVLRRDFPHVAGHLRLDLSTLSLDRRMALSLLNMGWPLMLNALLVGLFFRADQFIIKPIAGGLAVEQYQAAYSFINFVLLITPAVTLALFPRMARHAATDRARLAREYTFALKVLLLISVPVVLSTLWFAPLLITVLTGKPEYLPQSAIALQILILFLPFSFINGLTQYVLIALDLQRLITKAFGLTVAFNVTANLLLVPVLGIYGAALVTILSEIVLLIPFMIWTGREIGRVPILSMLGRPVVGGLAAGLLMWPLGPLAQHWSSDWVGLALYLSAGILIAMLSVAATLFLRHLTPAEMRVLLGAARFPGRQKAPPPVVEEGAGDRGVPAGR
jgi:O-antigen/teichoic acid export membrane protein